jgi:tetrahydromethanopterin S-methyltransferase subunit G
MDNTLATAIVSASSAVIVSVTALILNNKRFDDMAKRLDRIETTLSLIQGDLKEFYKDIAKIKAHIGL